MKIMTILGTRPEIIRLSRIIPLLDIACNHVLVHTGQNYDPKLSDIFFKDLDVRSPDYYLGINGDTPGKRIGEIISMSESLFAKEQPDRLLILGDTDSGLSALPAKRMGILVYHMEAGNRCYDERVPEEINRRIIDHTSDVLLPYTSGSRMNLIREGIHSQCILVTGNPIFEVMNHYRSKINSSSVLTNLNLKPEQYVLVTIHRAENVDQPERLSALIHGFDLVQKELNFPVLVSTHPRTSAMIERLGLTLDNPLVSFLPPFPFFDFIRLQSKAALVLTDSGTVQEECCLLHIPAVTLRDTTERPETLECGSNVLSGVDVDKIVSCTKAALSFNRDWIPPVEYVTSQVSEVVARILLSQSPTSAFSTAIHP